jgi:hypothetical protein
MTTLAYLLGGNPEWSDHTIRVLRIIQDEAGIEEATTGTSAMIAELRVDAEVTVVVSDEPPMEVIARTSTDSAVCFVGVAVSAGAPEVNPLLQYKALVARLRGDVFLAKSWHDLNL